MKPKITAVLIVLLFAFSCKKDSNSPSLAGKWQYAGPILFTVNIAGGLYVQFETNGQVQSTYFTDCTKYSITGNNSVALTFTGQYAGTDAYDYSINGDTLKMTAKNCTQGCTVPFVRDTN
jgi:hypothetical protein